MASSRSGRLPIAAGAVARRRGRLRRRLVHHEHGLLAGLAALTAVGVAVMLLFRDAVTASVLMVPLLLSGMLLPPRRLPAFVTTLFLVLCGETLVEYAVLSEHHVIHPRRWVSIGLVAMMSVVTVLVSGRRARLGVAGVRGDALLMELQDRLQREGRVPVLPESWHANVATQAAGGTSFVGDFLVGHLTDDEKLSLVVVDVSGKGVTAGTRSLLLSGAFSGLLGAVPADRFLPAANDFLLRQSWEDEFATAVHLYVDLRTGGYEVRSAGHPPVVHFVAGSGRWRVCDDADGPVLGVLPQPEFQVVTGLMASGDVLMLYTDGLVERTRRDIYLGIDRLVGEGERLLKEGLHDAASVLVRKLGSPNDDCALVVLQRR